jgi:hypothetical protein
MSEWTLLLSEVDDHEPSAAVWERVRSSAPGNMGRPPGPASTDRGVRRPLAGRLVRLALAAVGVAAVISIMVVAAHTRSVHPQESSRGPSPSDGLAPLSQPASTVQIIGGSPAQRTALRGFLGGLRWTPIRSVTIASDADHSGMPGGGFSYTIAAPAAARAKAVVAMQGVWQAYMVSLTYDAQRKSLGLPRTRWSGYAFVLPNGDHVGGGANVVPSNEYRGLGSLPSTDTIRARVTQAAAEAGFTIRHLGFVQPGPSLPVLILGTHDHRQLGQRLDTIARATVMHNLTLPAYVELDSACGRPVFARGAGVAVDPAWFSICQFSLGCPDQGSNAARNRLTYPC